MAVTNYDHCLHFHVTDKRLILAEGSPNEVVSDNFGNICIHVEFDEQWDGCGKTARFIYGGQYIDKVLDSDGECICPNEVIKKGRFELGIFGADLKATTPVIVNVAASIISESGSEMPPDPSEDVYTQLLKVCVEARDAAEGATKATEEAADAIKKSTTALVDATKACNDAAERGIYIGDGDMPEHYNVQLDPDGDTLEVDDELNPESSNPISNKAVAEALESFKGDVAEEVSALKARKIASTSEYSDFMSFQEQYSKYEILMMFVNGYDVDGNTIMCTVIMPKSPFGGYYGQELVRVYDGISGQEAFLSCNCMLPELNDFNQEYREPSIIGKAHDRPWYVLYGL